MRANKLRIPDREEIDLGGFTRAWK